jgi:hypothetical protein
MRTYGGVFLTSALDGSEWSASLPGRFTPGERALSTHWIGRWVGHREFLDDVVRTKFLPLPGLKLGLQSPYRLSYHSFCKYYSNISRTSDRFAGGSALVMC